MEALSSESTEPHVLPRPLSREEIPRLLPWLDDRLRRGLRGRLRAEYPMSLGPGAASCHFVVEGGGAPLAHAMGFCLDSQIKNGNALRLGLISLVYTEPRARGLGLASRCVEACVEALRAEDRSLALLWSDQRRLYRRLGFHLAGAERVFRLEATDCVAADLEFGFATSTDWPRLAELYAAKGLRALRGAAALSECAAAPATTLLVARRHGSPIAYAALGRGDDFAGVIHEWAGDASGVLGCAQVLARANQKHGGVALLAGPEDDPVTRALLSRGIPATVGPLGWMRLLSRSALERDLGVGIPDDEKDQPLLERCFGAPGQERPAIAPFYLWGFDSI